MAVAVQANSLSAITAIADEPPVSLAQSIQWNTGPLILYIVKVPGSKDVFLTPLKPQGKSVTAQDVQSSLYYFHVHCDDDASALNIDKPVQSPTTRPSSELLTRQLASKLDVAISQSRPLPPIPPEPSDVLSRGVDSRASYKSPPYPDDNHGRPLFNGYNVEVKPRPQSFTVKRKPVGAATLLRPRLNVVNEHNVQHDVAIPSLQGRSYSDSLLTKDENDQPSLPPRRPISMDRYFLITPPDLENLGENKFETSSRASLDTQEPDPLAKARADERVQITMIRRDPSSSQQWNVGNISDPPVFDVTSQSGTKRKRGQPIYIDMPTPGYSKFEAIAQSSVPELVGEPLSVFTRRLWIEGSLLDNAGMHRKSLSDDRTMLPAPLRTGAESRASFDSSSEQHTRSQSSQGLSLSTNGPRTKTRNYTFMSPWDTRCEFVTSIGHSLKCRHSTPGIHSTSDPVDISELRLNLPGGGPMPSQKMEPTQKPRRSKLLGLGRRKLFSEDVYPEEDTSDRLDLTLGREKAGGGFAGKQAKLGKLIIEPEGLKMLDLLVAANMALWWRAYEKG